MRVLVKRNESPKVARIVCYWCGSDLEVYQNDFVECKLRDGTRNGFNVACGACDAPINFPNIPPCDKTPMPMTDEELAVSKVKVKKNAR